MVKRPTPESGVQRAVLDLLAAERIFALRLNTGAFRTESGRPIFMHSGGAGVADILAFPWVRPFRVPTFPKLPQPLWIEVKSNTGRQTQEQSGFQQKVESEGHAYLLVRRPEELLEWLEAHRG